MRRTYIVTVGKDVNAIVSCTQGFSHIPINRYTLLFASIFDVFADTVLELAILVGKSSALRKHIPSRSCDANIDASDACRGRDITGNREANHELLDIRNLLGSLSLLVSALSIDACRVELACDGDFIGE